MLRLINDNERGLYSLDMPIIDEFEITHYEPYIDDLTLCF